MADLLTDSEKTRIVEAIRKAELDTSGEIRVHVQWRTAGDIFDAAKAKFDELEMGATELANGVLLFVSIDDRQVALLGDAGINEKVPDGFWQETVDAMLPLFREAEYAAGIEAGVLKAGEALKEFFPYQQDDANELPDEISTGD